jgi:hypothetical protein
MSRGKLLGSIESCCRTEVSMIFMTVPGVMLPMDPFRVPWYSCVSIDSLEQ